MCVVTGGGEEEEDEEGKVGKVIAEVNLNNREIRSKPEENLR